MSRKLNQVKLKEKDHEEVCSNTHDKVVLTDDEWSKLQNTKSYKIKSMYCFGLIPNFKECEIASSSDFILYDLVFWI